MLKTEELVHNFIEEQGYDKRIIPFLQQFFQYHVQQSHWDEQTVSRKIALLKERLNGIEFVDLGNEMARTDFEFYQLLMNEALKTRPLSPEEIVQCTAEIFQGLDLMTKEVETYQLKSWKHKPFYPLETLNYCSNKQEKEHVIHFIANAFHVDATDVPNIGGIFEKRLKNTKEISKEEKDFLEDSLSTFLPEVANSVKTILQDSNDMKKAEEYMHLYAISLLAIHYRLENKAEDKETLKKEYQAIQKTFAAIAEESILTADSLKESRINSTWVIYPEELSQEIQNSLRTVPLKEEEDSPKVESFSDSLKEDFLSKGQTIFTEEPLTEEEIEEQLNHKILPYQEDKFKPLIQEYFRRSAKVYHWTKDEFDKKVRNYQKGVKSIQLEKASPTATEANWERDHINIQDDFRFSGRQSTLATFFHEQEHATDSTYRENTQIENGLAMSKKYFNINEYATEIGAMHLVGEQQYEDALCFTHRMKGYDEMQYAGSMMAAALGISEFTFAQLRNKGEATFNRVLEEKFSYLPIKEAMEEWNVILTRMRNAPYLFNMQELSEAYADNYCLASKIMAARLEHEKETVSEEEKDYFALKSKYEKTKMAINMNLAKRKLHLKEKYIQPKLGEETTLRKDAHVTKEDRKQYLQLVETLYPEKNLQFENREILKHIQQELRYPILGKVAKLFRKEKKMLLAAPTEEKKMTTARTEHIRFQGELQQGIQTIPTIERLEKEERHSSPTHPELGEK